MRLEMQSSSGNILLIIIIAAAILAFIIIISYRKGGSSPQKRLRRLREQYMKFKVKRTDMKPLLREQSSVPESTGTKKHKKVVYWIVAVSVLAIMVIGAVYLFSGSDDDTDAYRMGLKGNVVTIDEKSYYSGGFGSETDKNLFDGNIFLAYVFGDEHGAWLPFNYLLFYSSNVSLSFNEQGNVETLVSNSQDGGVITFQYDADGNLVRQDARSILDGEIRRYRDGQIIEGRFKGMMKEKTQTGKIILRMNGEYEMFAEIELDKDNRLKRLYLPGYWGKSSSVNKASYAEYIFEYNADGWPTRIISSTGKKGSGQIVTTFSYSDYDRYNNWLKRTAHVDWRHGNEQAWLSIETTRRISYRPSWLEEHFPYIYYKWFY